MIRELTNKDLIKVKELGSLLNKNFDKLYDYNSLNGEVNKTYVIEENNVVIGFIHIQDLFDEIDVIDVVIGEHHRNKGYATKLFEYILDIYNKKFILEVNENNNKALNLYNKLGFKEINRRKGYYSGIDAIVMERK